LIDDAQVLGPSSSSHRSPSPSSYPRNPIPVVVSAFSPPLWLMLLNLPGNILAYCLDTHIRICWPSELPVFQYALPTYPTHPTPKREPDYNLSHFALAGRLISMSCTTLSVKHAWCEVAVAYRWCTISI